MCLQCGCALLSLSRGVFAAGQWLIDGEIYLIEYICFYSIGWRLKKTCKNQKRIFETLLRENGSHGQVSKYFVNEKSQSMCSFSPRWPEVKQSPSVDLWPQLPGVTEVQSSSERADERMSG